MNEIKTLSQDEQTKKGMKAVDFFCGAGGMSYGLSKAGIDVLAGIDIEEQFGKSYKKNIPKSKFIKQDITKYYPQDLAAELDIKPYDDSLIFVGCSPCQYWSKVNKDNHKSFFTSNLLFDFERFIHYFKPGFVIVENVPGILLKSNNHILLNFLDFLSFNSYNYKYEIANLTEFGIPQTRKRFLLVASRLSNNIEFPRRNVIKNINVEDHLGVKNGFKRISAGHEDKSSFLHTSSGLSKSNLERIKATPKNGGTREAWSHDKLNPSQTKLPNGFRDVYARMRWDRPAPTITTRFNSFSNGRFGHPEEDRAISLREGATLQTFPKEYHFIGNKVSIAKQIGNAVPPLMAQQIGEILFEIYTAYLKNVQVAC